MKTEPGTIIEITSNDPLRDGQKLEIYNCVKNAMGQIFKQALFKGMVFVREKEKGEYYVIHIACNEFLPAELQKEVLSKLPKLLMTSFFKADYFPANIKIGHEDDFPSIFDLGNNDQKVEDKKTEEIFKPDDDFGTHLKPNSEIKNDPFLDRFNDTKGKSGVKCYSGPY